VRVRTVAPRGICPLARFSRMVAEAPEAASPPVVASVSVSSYLCFCKSVQSYVVRLPNFSRPDHPMLSLFRKKPSMMGSYDEFLRRMRRIQVPPLQKHHRVSDPASVELIIPAPKNMTDPKKKGTNCKRTSGFARSRSFSQM